MKTPTPTPAAIRQSTIRSVSFQKGRHTVLLLMLLASTIFDIQAQRSYGGSPYPENIERSAAVTKSLNNYTIDLPAFNIDSVLYEDSLYFNMHGPLHFAHCIPVNLSPDNAGLTFYTEDGVKVWKVALRSEGAYSLNVIFERFRVPEGAQLFLYNPDRSQVLGAFTKDNMQESGEFPIAPVAGDELIIEYHEPQDAEFEGELQILGVNHDYRGGFTRLGGKFQYLNMPCLPHLSCDSQYNLIGRSVCLLILNGNTYCTGTFVNNTRQDGTPYILTASHCLYNNPALGNRTVVFMNYGCPRCLSDIQGSEEFSLSGCTTKALSHEVDFALLALDEIPPSDYRPYYTGWDRDSTLTGNVPFTGIHHPYGEGKRYAIEEDAIVRSSWKSTTDSIASGNHWRVKKWETGHTWGGSSGSALFDKNFHIIGTLTGGDSGGSTGCSSYQHPNGDFYARIDRAWDQFSDPNKQLKCWLDPDNTKASSIDGLDPWGKQASGRISNLTDEDNIECIRLENASGYLFGHNSLNTISFAEAFQTDNNALLQGVYIMPAKGIKSSAYPVSVQIYEGGNTLKTILAETTMNPHYIEYSSPSFSAKAKTDFANKENYIRFNSPIKVKKQFYVACRIQYPNKGTAIDTFALYAARHETNTAWLYNDGWQTANTFSELSAALWIEPVIRIDHGETSSEDSLKTNHSIRFFYTKSDRLLYVSAPEIIDDYFVMNIFDITGKNVYQKNFQLSPISIPTWISGGLYLISITYGNLHGVEKIIL